MGLMDWARPSREHWVGTIAGSGDPAHQSSHAQLMTRLGDAGVPASAVIDALRPTGQPDVRGGQRVLVRVTISPVGGQPYQTTIVQSFLPSQMEDLSPGKTISVKYDPEDPSAALISVW
jgi:hypothetical protein